MGKRSKRKQREVSERKPADGGLHKKTLNHSREGIQKPVLHCLLIALVALLAYSNTFRSPFQWDEEDFIVQNPIVRDLGYFASPSKAKGIDPDYEIFLRTRYVGYLTFAANYQIHGFDVLGYHIVNVIIHILNAVLVYLLVQLTFKTPFLKETTLRNHSGSIALFSALLFVSHPAQTEAVTYIFQRHASFVTLFYIGSLVCYILWRLEGEAKEGSKWKRFSVYGLSFLFCVLAMKTKENAFTLPIILLLYEYFFFEGSIALRVIHLAPFLLTLVIIPFTLLGGERSLGEMMDRILDPSSLLTKGVAKETYLLTQFRVMVTYLRLLLIPVNQNLDYDYPLFSSVLTPEVLASLLLHLALLGTAVTLFLKSKSTLRDWRVISFGILWFYITLSVESSIIPLKMIICEYRIYLPSVGFFVGVLSLMFLGVVRFGGTSGRVRKYVIVFLACVVGLFTALTFARNSLWADPVRLWADTARKSPANSRARYNFGLALARQGRFDEATKEFQTTLNLNPQDAKAHLNLGLIYDQQNRPEDALRELQVALELEPNNAKVHYNFGVTLARWGRTEEAKKAFENTVKINPHDASAHNNLGVLLTQQNRIKEAMNEFEAALQLDPDHTSARRNLEKLRHLSPSP
jgi:Flp pilus assembly protein TadD